MSGELFRRLVNAAGEDWPAYTRHSFVLALARGDLPEAAFRRYLVQDYLFLLHFARAWGLAIYKSDSLPEMRRAQSLVSATLDNPVDILGDAGLVEKPAIRETPAKSAPKAKAQARAKEAEEAAGAASGSA